MNNILPKQTTVNLAFIAVAILIAAFAAEASPQPENLLLSAGFKAKVAKTVSQRQELKTLAKGTVSPVTQNGKTFYVYPDARRNQLFVGNQVQHRAYQELLTKPRGSARPIVNKDYIQGQPIKVREIYGWEPFDEITQ